MLLFDVKKIKEAFKILYELILNLDIPEYMKFKGLNYNLFIILFITLLYFFIL